MYVDDVIVTGSNNLLISQLIDTLDNKFALKDLGLLSYFLGIQVNRLSAGLMLTQDKYVSDLLHKLNLEDLKLAPSPCIIGKHLSINEGQALDDPFIYRSTIGALQYLTHTRPDNAYIVNHLSQFLKQPTDIHWKAMKRVLRYISGTKHLGLLIQPCSDLNISAFLDVDWASNIDDHKSVAAYCVCFR